MAESVNPKFAASSPRPPESTYWVDSGKYFGQAGKDGQLFVGPDRRWYPAIAMTKTSYLTMTGMNRQEFDAAPPGMQRCGSRAFGPPGTEVPAASHALRNL
jgi:hypothetical protein